MVVWGGRFVSLGIPVQSNVKGEMENHVMESSMLYCPFVLDTALLQASFCSKLPR